MVSDKVLPVCIILGLNFIITNNIVFDYCWSTICINYQVYIPVNNFHSAGSNQLCHIKCYQGYEDNVFESSNKEIVLESLSLLDKDQILDLQKRDYVLRQVKQWLLKKRL